MTTVPAPTPAGNAERRTARPRLRPPTRPAVAPLIPATLPTPVDPPAAAVRDAVGTSDRAVNRARYEILVSTQVNRIGHEVIVAARHLSQLLEQFQDAAGSNEVYDAFINARLSLHDSADVAGHHADYFDGAMQDAHGFAWVLDLFTNVFESGLVRNPNLLLPRSRPARS